MRLFSKFYLPALAVVGSFVASGLAEDQCRCANAGCTPVYENGTSIYGDPKAGKQGCLNGALPTNLGNSSLSIWTHNLTSIELRDDFNLTCPNAADTHSPRMAATIGAGVQDGEMYEALAAQNALAVGGTSSDVGVIGWATGGGHGFATGKYGQGPDNILQAEIVTPAGKVLIANQCQNQDLYWAICGGGGGTFGVITKLTVKAYPAPELVIGGFGIKAKNQTSEAEFYKVIADAHPLFPEIQDAGVHGYYTVTGPPEAEALTFSGSFIGFGISNKTYDNALASSIEMLEAPNGTVTWSLNKLPVSTWQELLKILPDIGTTVMEKTEEFEAVYKKIGPTKEAPLNGLPNLSISGTLTISPKPVNNSLHPSWRSATVHLIIGQSWTDPTNETQVRDIVHDMTNRKLKSLRELDLAQGAYLNEGNSIEPDWQWSFWELNYARLREIKERYDPEGLLWYPQCVGSEDWVQRQDGRLYRTFTPW
ncbi:FAD-linked oxidoreductase ZEB1 [Fusarium oxysporum f. sp. rapae]|uniref:FAD-linked oxidoreductase ZEB1 n=1 Tax=Fusarium oxysporum f. sp. rapae TaxID=485398 RepID=A0A8J5TZE2_FUSOX|nr:FAD-linked oxidoreductase ZEB1 [Fusarium oxysporum f. sp. rapae]